MIMRGGHVDYPELSTCGSQESSAVTWRPSSSSVMVISFRPGTGRAVIAGFARVRRYGRLACRHRPMKCSLVIPLGRPYGCP